MCLDGIHRVGTTAQWALHCGSVQCCGRRQEPRAYVAAQASRGSSPQCKGGRVCRAHLGTTIKFESISLKFCLAQLSVAGSQLVARVRREPWSCCGRCPPSHLSCNASKVHHVSLRIRLNPAGAHLREGGGRTLRHPPALLSTSILRATIQALAGNLAHLLAPRRHFPRTLHSHELQPRPDTQTRTLHCAAYHISWTQTDALLTTATR